MAPRKEISVDVRNLVIKHRKEKKSYGEISKILNLSRATVQTIVKNFENSGYTEDKPRSGRPMKLSRRDVSFIIREVDKNPKVTAPKLAEHIANISQKSIHPRTIQRTLKDNGFRRRTPRKKPLLSEKNRKLRLEFAKEHKEKGIDFWKKVLFTDESKFNIFGSDGRAKVWRKTNTALDPKNLVSTVKHGGGSVMVWGAVASSGVGRLAFIEGNMDRYQYKSLLEHNLKPSVDNLHLGSGWIFQQDNDPKHTAKIIKEWLLYYAPRQLNTQI